MAVVVPRVVLDSARTVDVPAGIGSVASVELEPGAYVFKYSFVVFPEPLLVDGTQAQAGTSFVLDSFPIFPFWIRSGTFTVINQQAGAFRLHFAKAW